MPLPRKKHPKRPERDYAALAHASYEAAMNESFPLPLRQYYAAMALWADKRAQA